MNCISPKLLLTFLLPLFVFYTDAQTHTIDSLRDKLMHTSIAEEKKNIVLAICQRSYSLSADSLLKYIEIGQPLCATHSRDFVRMRNYYCIYLSKLGKLQEGLALSDSLVQNAIDAKNIDRAGMDILSTRCAGLIRNGQNKEAIEQCFNILEYAEPLKDTIGLIGAYNLMGWANMELDQYRDAVKWFRKSLSFTDSQNLVEKGGVIFANIASCYNNINNPDSAFYFIDLALKYSRLGENLTSHANALNIRADMFINKKDFASAENDMKEALEVRKHLGDPMYLISDMAQLSSFYASIGQTEKGIELAQNGIAIARNSNNLTKLIYLYTALGENYKKANRMNEYSASLETIVQLKDSLYKNNSGDAIAEMAAKYELQKKENIIIRQKYDLNRSRYLSIGSAILFVLGLLLIWALYRYYRLKQKRKMETALAEQKLLSYKAVEQAEEKERKRIAADLHDNLGSYAAAITANVKYLKDRPGNTDESILSQLDGNAQNMVTQLGDTIWVLKNEQLPITKLADRFKSWMLRLMQNYPHIKYHYQENIIEDVEFTPSRILHIFLILKECVNNSVKHSDCTEIRIAFFSDNYWSVTIEDNGKGFEYNNVLIGSGISNIRNRAVECGWDVEWQKAFPTGTRVIICGSTTK